MDLVSVLKQSITVSPKEKKSASGWIIILILKPAPA
jgi:hypothetical protein|tara:strand:+ start:1289 stop:1396 length:108 start_codon:yes stop_codon:yes gene_type:complete